MPKIEVFVIVEVDTDEYVLPTPTYEADPKGFVAGIFSEWDTAGLSEERHLTVYYRPEDTPWGPPTHLVYRRSI